MAGRDPDRHNLPDDRHRPDEVRKNDVGENPETNRRRPDTKDEDDDD